jgi:hypothetical protein
MIEARSPTTITHGRHCTCSACARQDWTEPQLACCGMHGPSCPPVYAPLGAPGQRMSESAVQGNERLRVRIGRSGPTLGDIAFRLVFMAVVALWVYAIVLVVVSP